MPLKTPSLWLTPKRMATPDEAADRGQPESMAPVPDMWEIMEEERDFAWQKTDGLDDTTRVTILQGAAEEERDFLSSDQTYAQGQSNPQAQQTKHMWDWVNSFRSRHSKPNICGTGSTVFVRELPLLPNNIACHLEALLLAHSKFRVQIGVEGAIGAGKWAHVEHHGRSWSIVSPRGAS